jgi:hypothetical protein
MHAKLEALFDRQFEDAAAHNDITNMLIIELARVQELTRELYVPKDGEIRGSYLRGFSDDE